MGRTDSNASGCAPLEERFNPLLDDFEPKSRPYIHFDLPLSQAEREDYRPSADDLFRHSFWPLLGFVKEQRRIKPDESGNGILIKTKERDIRFASHKDAAVLEYYCKYLSDRYENFLSNSPINSAVLAYRSDVGDNVSQAKIMFDDIVKKGNCHAVGMDISGFFDNIDHGVLSDCIKELYHTDRMPECDFSIFKNMTRYSWIEEKDIKLRMNGVRPPKGRICSPKQFRKLFREAKPSIINTNNTGYGIPQGTPISGLYANISMIAFDEWAVAYMDEIGGSYRRYSDDIALIIPICVERESVIADFYREIARVNLQFNADKTDISLFQVNQNGLSCDSEFQYLGFVFDGKIIRIRSSSLNNYYRKMRKGVRAKVLAAKAQDVDGKNIFMRELYRRYTHYGRSRNFVRYAYRAAEVMNSPTIRRQVAGHMEHFRKVVEGAVNAAYR